MISRKRLKAKHEFKLAKITERAGRIAHWADMMSKKTGEDYYKLVVERLNMLSLKHISRTIDKQRQLQLIAEDTPLHRAALDEIISRQILGKHIVPWKHKDLRKMRKRKRKLRWKF